MACESLVKTPSKEHMRKDLTDKPVLFWPVRSYLIVNRPKTKPLQIVGVLYGSRDITRALQM
ncbi:MAG: hypothetical protein HYR55_19280 [Acidobacteria bacterium]|nr:hypothetical protein [Acidobacteriota bacterium]MBI3655813.1 hypothetical protein [Acidobacteriota bacterium]